jgi:hypothetical protein
MNVLTIGDSMTASESIVLARKTTLPALIAWLSVCMIAASWGPELGPSLCESWGWTGLFGLTAAVGLELTERSRLLLKIRSQVNTTNQRIDRTIADAAFVGDPQLAK